MRKRSLFKGQGPWRRQSSGSLLKDVTKEVLLAFGGRQGSHIPTGVTLGLTLSSFSCFMIFEHFSLASDCTCAGV